MVATAKQLHVPLSAAAYVVAASCVAEYHDTWLTDDRLGASLLGLGPGWVVVVGVVLVWAPFRSSLASVSSGGVHGRQPVAFDGGWGSTNMWKASHFGRGQGEGVLSHTNTCG